MPDTVTAAEIDGKPSHDDIRGMLSRAINPTGSYGMDGPYIHEVGSKSCVVNLNGKSWRYPYTIDGDTATLGTPVEVKLTWKDSGGRVAAADEPDTMAFVTDLRGLVFSDCETVKIEVCRDGKWNHPKYGDIVINPEVRSTFAENFRANVRKVGDLPLDYDHREGPAAGWIAGLQNEGTSLFADVKLTTAARAKVESGEYRFFSPEFVRAWEDPETGTKHGPTIFGGGLTNRPFFRGMAAIACSELGGALEADNGGHAPQEDSQMPETTPAGAQTEVPAAGTPTEPIQASERTTEPTPVQATDQVVMTAAEVRQMTERITALESREAVLLAAEERRTITDELGALRFHEGRATIAPAARNALAGALVGVPADKRAAVVSAVKGLAFVELGERATNGQEQPGEVTLTASERISVRALAKEMGVPEAEAEAKFLETKAARMMERAGIA